MTPLEPGHVLCIGLMSGTSMDGVDGALALMRDPGGPADAPPGFVRVLAHAHRALPGELRDTLMALNTPGDNELHRAALAGNALARLQGEVVADLLAHARLKPEQVRAVGSHGQTVRHRPGEFDGTGYTLQLNQPALLAECCGIDVVADFRSRDVAAGGQGAPLVPAFHAEVFGQQDRPVAVLNLGGIANLTLVPARTDGDGDLIGFDCGPGNALMDHWVQQHRGLPFDADGAWAASGQVLPDLLSRWLAEPFLQQAPPKSTGRDLFNVDWLARHGVDGAAGDRPGQRPQDVMATLAEFSVRAAADALHRSAPKVARLLVCGGGALNGHLMRRLGLALPGVSVARSDEAGLPAMQVEAAAFAWLAWAHGLRRAGQRPSVTGARGPRVLGANHPA